MKRCASLAASCTMALALSLGSIGTVAAQDRDYKTAMEECFWGLLFPDEDQRGISLALNVVSGALGSWAFTSGTLTPDTFCSDKKLATAQLITESYPKLAEDIVRGEGEYLNAALDLSECTTPGSRALVAEQMRGDFQQVLGSAAYSGLNERQRAWLMFESLHTRSAGHCTV